MICQAKKNWKGDFMDRKQKVTSLELAKELQKVSDKFGFELPESEHSHLVVEDKYNTASEIVNFSRENRSGKYNDGTKWSEKFYNAYDTSELGEMLDKIKIDICRKPFLRYSIDRPAEHNYEIIDGEKHYTYKNISDDNLAEAMGKMLCYLLDNNLL